MKRFCMVLVVAMLVGLYAGEAVAQRPFRSGFWIETGTGTGGVWIGCTTCDDPMTAYGESTYIRGGGAFSERVLWGIEFFTLLDETFEPAEGDSALTIRSLSIAPVVLWYPWQSGLFVKGGVGLSRGEVLVERTDENPAILASGTGSGITFGVGFDVPVFKWLSITANFGIYFGAIGDVVVQDTYVDDVITTMYNTNFALTIR